MTAPAGDGTRWEFTGACSAPVAQEVKVERLQLGRLLAGRAGRRARRVLSLGLSVLLAAFFVPISLASGQQRAAGRALPRSVKTSSDQARHKLDKDLLALYDRHAAGTVPVFVSVVGNSTGVWPHLPNTHPPPPRATP